MSIEGPDSVKGARRNPDHRPAAGQVLRGKYRIERTLGSGGMGVVVLATQLRVERRVAIKLLRAEMRDREEIVQRFAREARAASRLRGEHAVRVLDVEDGEAGDPFLVMEYLDGRDLLSLLEAEGPLGIARAASYLMQACEGVAEAHAAGIVHRDLKPANLFLTQRPDGTELLKILDFGISKAVETEAAGDSLITQPAVAMGSPAYMSPEHLKNAASVDARTDIWSLGVVLYQLLTCALPFEATTTAALAARIAADAPVPLASRRPDARADLEAVVRRCLAKEPADRFPDVAALARALAPFVERGESSAQRVMRVLSAAAPSSDADSADPAGPRAARASQAPTSTSAHSAGTASIHGSILAPLAHALGTEYASTLGQSPVELAVPQRTDARRRLAIVMVVLGALAAGVVALFSDRVSVAPSPSSTLGGAQSISRPADGPSARTVSTAPSTTLSAEPIGASSRPRDAGGRARPPLHAKPSATARNPLDLDFR